MKVLSKMEENEKKSSSELKFKFIPKAWKREAMAQKSPLKGCSFKIEILTRLLSFFNLNLTIWFSCLKTWVDGSWVGGYLWVFFSFKKENYKGGICVMCDVT